MRGFLFDIFRHGFSDKITGFMANAEKMFSAFDAEEFFVRSNEQGFFVIH